MREPGLITRRSLVQIQPPQLETGSVTGSQLAALFDFGISIRLEASNCIAETVIGQDVQQPCKRPLPKTD